VQARCAAERWKWRADHLFALVPAGALVGQWLQTLAEFTPRQRLESWSVGDVLEKLRKNQEALDAGK